MKKLFGFLALCAMFLANPLLSRVDAQSIDVDICSIDTMATYTFYSYNDPGRAIAILGTDTVGDIHMQAWDIASGYAHNLLPGQMYQLECKFLPDSGNISATISDYWFNTLPQPAIMAIPGSIFAIEDYVGLQAVFTDGTPDIIFINIPVYVQYGYEAGNLPFSTPAQYLVDQGTTAFIIPNVSDCETLYYRAVISIGSWCGTVVGEDFGMIETYCPVATSISASTTTETGLQIMGNPISDDVIRYSVSSAGDVALIDLQGHVITQQTASVGVNQISAETISAGLYFLQFICEDGVATKKVLIE